MTTSTSRYGFPQIDESTDVVNVALDFNDPWATLDTILNSQIATRTTLPSTPAKGQTVITTDTNMYGVNIGTSGSPIWMNISSNSDWFNVVWYGADPTNAADSTTAIQAAINACHAANGGIVYFPPGTYKVTPVSATSAALVLNNGSTTGYQGVRLVGASQGNAILKRASAGPIISMSGAVSDTTGVTHARYCSLENIQLHGNSLTGSLVQAYYADTHFFQNVHLTNSNDVLFDTAEFWDSRFHNVLFDSSGYVTTGTTAPMLWLRNTAAASGFGYSTGTTNNIYFTDCRWEQPKTGAVRIERGVGTNAGQPYSIYFNHSKFETAVVNGGPLFYVDTTSRDIRVRDAHAYVGGFFTGFSTPEDVFSFSPQFGLLQDILIFNSTAVACIADGVTVSPSLAGATIELRRVRGSYTGGATPTGAHINYGTMTGNVVVEDCNADAGTNFTGNSPIWFQKDVLGGTPTTIANTAALSTLYTYTIPAGEPFNRTVYKMVGFGTYEVTATPTLTFGVYWGGTAGTLLAALGAITAPTAGSVLSFKYEIEVHFRTATSVECNIVLYLQTNAASSTTIMYSTSTTAAVTVASSAAEALAVGFTWGTASASNTISLRAARTIKEA
jgi:Pectate lyase superfamily protein